MGTGPHQVLAGIFQPGVVDSAHPFILMSSTSFESHRQRKSSMIGITIGKAAYFAYISQSSYKRAAMISY